MAGGKKKGHKAPSSAGSAKAITESVPIEDDSADFIQDSENTAQASERVDSGVDFASVAAPYVEKSGNGTGNEEEEEEEEKEEDGSQKGDSETKGQMTQRHKRELKDLKVAIQKKMHGVKKGDKTAKKEMEAETKKMEDDLLERQKNELLELEKKLGELSVSHATTSGVSDDTTDKAIAGDGDDSENGDDDDSPVNLSAQKASVPIAAEPKKPKGPSRQQLRKARKADEEKKRRQEIEAECAKGIDRRAIEKEQLERVLLPLNLAIYQIPPDGNCLYRAVFHQLQRVGVERGSQKDGYTGVRQIAASYLRGHVDDFLPFMITESGDMHTPESFAEYCNRVANSTDWGGEIELRAISNAMRIPITVFMANSPKLEMGKEFLSTSQEPLLLSYHLHEYGLGAHYNSVVPRS